jgi:hypothetical protein
VKIRVIRGLLLIPKNKEKVMTNTTACPVCDAIINLAEDTVQDELLPCHECGPFVLDEAPQAEEDWGE